MAEYFGNIVKILSNYWDVFLITGVGYTLLLSFITVAVGSILGVFLCLGRMARFKPLNWVVKAFVEVVRGTPLLLQLYIFYFLVPKILPFTVSDFGSVAIGLVINSGAYVSEVFRSGIQAVDRGQSEAARSLGLTSSMTMRRIVLPQAIKNILPALCNEFIMMIKETSLASTFFAGDIMSQYKIINGAMYMVIEPLIIIAAIYFVLTFTLSKLVAVFERRLAVSD